MRSGIHAIPHRLIQVGTVLSLCKFSAAFSCQNGDSRHVRVYTRLERYSPLKGYIRDGGGENAPSIVSTVHAALYAEPSRTYLINPLTTRIEASRKDLRSRADNVRHALTLHAVRKVLSRAYECEAISSSSNFPLRFSDILSKASFTTASPLSAAISAFSLEGNLLPGKILLLINSNMATTSRD